RAERSSALGRPAIRGKVEEGTGLGALRAGPANPSFACPISAALRRTLRFKSCSRDALPWRVAALADRRFFPEERWWWEQDWARCARVLRTQASLAPSPLRSVEPHGSNPVP